LFSLINYNWWWGVREESLLNRYDFEVKNKDGETVLTLAAKKGYLASLHWLTKSNAKLD